MAFTDDLSSRATLQNNYGVELTDAQHHELIVTAGVREMEDKYEYERTRYGGPLTRYDYLRLLAGQSRNPKPLTAAAPVTGSGNVTLGTTLEAVTRAGVTRTLPAAPVGWEYAVVSGVDATVKLGAPTGWRFEYERHAEGRPVVSRRGGIMRVRVVEPFVYLVSGDYSVAHNGWHPTDVAGLFGVWQAGYGHYSGNGCTATLGAAEAESRVLVWKQRWGAGHVFRYEAENQGSSNVDSFCPGLASDAYGRYLLLRGGGGDWRPLICSGVPAGGQFSVYAGIRFYNTGWPLLNQRGTFLNLAGEIGAGWGSISAQQGGLLWYSDAQRWQAIHSGASVAWGAKPAADAIEETTDLVSLACHFSADGESTIYINDTLVTSPVTATNTAFTPNKLEINTGMPLNLHWLAVVSGAATDQHRKFFQNFYK